MCSSLRHEIACTELSILADEAEALVRCSPGEDGTNGFFVSMFVREDGDEDDGSLIRKEGKRKAESEGENSTHRPSKKRKKKRSKPVHK